MAIKIEKQFTIDADPDAVWAFLTDPHRVAAALPGAAVTEQLDERTYAGTMTVKVGPVSTSYKGKITFEQLDPEARTAQLRGTGQDVKGRGGAEMRMTSRLSPEEGGTAVSVVSEVGVTGMLAQFGRGMIEDVSEQLFGTFTANMRGALAEGSGGPPPAQADAALDVVALGASAGSRALGRMIRRPPFWVALALLAVIVYLLFIR